MPKHAPHSAVTLGTLPSNPPLPPRVIGKLSLYLSEEYNGRTTVLTGPAKRENGKKRIKLPEFTFDKIERHTGTDRITPQTVNAAQERTLAILGNMPYALRPQSVALRVHPVVLKLEIPPHVQSDAFPYDEVHFVCVHAALLVPAVHLHDLPVQTFRTQQYLESGCPSYRQAMYHALGQAFGNPPAVPPPSVTRH